MKAKKKTNFIFIGMAGVGKTTIANAFGEFMDIPMLDIDAVIHRINFMPCREVLECFGEERFARCEENACLSVNAKNTAIATGGSVVYSDKAMQHLKEIGTIIYLKASFPVIESRIEDPIARGVTGLDKKTLEEIYLERVPIYERWAEYTIDTDDKTVEEICEEIRSLVKI